MGFPDRPPRAAFGPQMKNKRAPVIAETDFSANQANLSFWQAAGAGRTVAMATILYDGVADSILSQALAFDPQQELDPLLLGHALPGAPRVGHAAGVPLRERCPLLLPIVSARHTSIAAP